jgi:hypothetical protein
LHKISRIGKFLEAMSRSAITERRGRGSYVLKTAEFLFGVLEMDRSDGCTTL